MYYNTRHNPVFTGNCVNAGCVSTYYNGFESPVLHSKKRPGIRNISGFPVFLTFLQKRQIPQNMAHIRLISGNAKMTGNRIPE